MVNGALLKNREREREAPVLFYRVPTAIFIAVFDAKVKCPPLSGEF